MCLKTCECPPGLHTRLSDFPVVNVTDAKFNCPQPQPHAQAASHEDGRISIHTDIRTEGGRDGDRQGYTGKKTKAWIN